MRTYRVEVCHTKYVGKHRVHVDGDQLLNAKVPDRRGPPSFDRCLRMYGQRSADSQSSVRRESTIPSRNGEFCHQSGTQRKPLRTSTNNERGDGWTDLHSPTTTASGLKVVGSRRPHNLSQSWRNRNRRRNGEAVYQRTRCAKIPQDYALLWSGSVEEHRLVLDFKFILGWVIFGGGISTGGFILSIPVF